MAMLLLKWDLPPEEMMGRYKQGIFFSDEGRKAWIQSIKIQKGFKEIRAYRNPLHTTPQTLVQCEFDTLESCMKYIESEQYTRLMSELKAIGCTNIDAELWRTSPLIPEPIGPVTK